jgi:2-haloacid dehalogenase
MPDHAPHREPTVFAFDADGTLFDVHAAVRRHAEAIGPDAARFSDLWRARQLEYTGVRTLAARYRDFWSLTEEALDFAFAAFPAVDRSLRAELLDAYRTLDCYPEVPGVLGRLRANGKQLAILSNGTPEMLQSAVRAARLEDSFDAVLSVDAIGIYKTDRRTYDLVTERFGVTAAAVSFQSSNRWDIAGAAAYGFRCMWINRTGAPDEYDDMTPAAILPSLEGLLRLG